MTSGGCLKRALSVSAAASVVFVLIKTNLITYNVYFESQYRILKCRSANSIAIFWKCVLQSHDFPVAAGDVIFSFFFLQVLNARKSQ